MIQMPKRQHSLKFQTSVPISATKQSARLFQNVVDAAAAHLRAVAGGAAFNVVVRAAYQDRGPGESGIVWRDLLVVCSFDGTLTEHAKKMAIERKHFEFERATGKAASPLDFGGTTQPARKVLLS